MSEKSAYTEYHPRWYRAPVSTFWWLQRPSYFLFILRELSSIFVAWFVVFLLLLVYAVSQGNDGYHRFLAWSASPWVLLINLVALLFVVLHAVTWFNLAPKAMAVRVRSTRIRPLWIAGSNYVAWALVSVFVAWLLLAG